jgi:4-diphosphocytidyl-2-C-methyl-D-erythritol kinase
MRLNANAKINLTLDITGVRPDGFHTLRSVMVPITLCDELVFEKSEKFVFDCNIDSLKTEDNLCVRAANRFFETTGVKPEVSVYLEKRIPFPAGLGGGSADAAVVLKGLNEFFGFPLSETELFSLAEKLGSDVPLCLLGRPALCEGRGEELTPIKMPCELNVVVAIGKSRLSTPSVYRRYDEMKLPIRNDSEKFLSFLEKGEVDEMISSMGNAFEPVADILAPETKQIRKLLKDFGAKASRLSGSGPSVFGIFETEDEAKKAIEKLETEGFSAYFCKTIK